MFSSMDTSHVTIVVYIDCTIDGQHTMASTHAMIKPTFTHWLSLTT